MESSSMQRFGCYLREKWVSPRRIRFWVLALVLLYTLLGFFALPWAIEYVATNTVKERYDRELRIESIQTNPYTLTLSIQQLQLNDIDDATLLGWQRLFVDLTWKSIANGAWTFERIELVQPVVNEARFASGETRFSRLMAAVAGASGASADASQEAAPLPAIVVQQLRVNGGTVRFTDEAVMASMTLQDMSVAVDDFSLQESARFPISLSGALKEGGKLSLDGDAQLLPDFAFSGTTGIDALALAPAGPYLQQFMKVQLDDGRLTLDGQLQIDAQQPLALQGSAAVDGLSVKNGMTGEALIGWQQVATDGFEFSLKDQRINTEPVRVTGLTGKVVIYEDKTTNFGQLVVAGADADADAENVSDSGAPDAEAAPFDVFIESIQLSDGVIQFADNSLPLPFSTRIHHLSGELTTLSSTSAEPARVKLEGEVAEYGLATVDGAVQVWNPMKQTNIQLNFRNLQVPEYSPYTVNFAGRKIAGGTMDVDLDYTIDDDQLQGENNLVLRNLKLGEKMASSDAMDLPLDLAIALLQDSNGVIDLTLPVSGNVNNPQFDFGKVIRQAIGKAITSVVTAPFRFLANLVGAGSEDLGKVEFAAGRSDLLPPQRERVGKLREALQQRPQLVLELAGPYDESFDGPVLKQQKALSALQQRIAEAGLETEDVSLTAEANQQIVEAMFSEHYPNISLPQLQENFTSQPDGEAAAEPVFDGLAYRNYLAGRIVAAQVVTKEDLFALADARAQAVKDALVSGAKAAVAVSAERVRVVAPEQRDAADDARIAMEAEVSAD